MQVIFKTQMKSLASSSLIRSCMIILVFCSFKSKQDYADCIRLNLKVQVRLQTYTCTYELDNTSSLVRLET
jgi:hypothetical protein